MNKERTLYFTHAKDPEPWVGFCENCETLLTFYYENKDAIPVELHRRLILEQCQFCDGINTSSQAYLKRDALSRKYCTGKYSAAPLTFAKCEKCGRGYSWSIVPDTCQWANCGGRLRRSARQSKRDREQVPA